MGLDQNLKDGLGELDKQRRNFQTLEKAGRKHCLDHLGSLQIFQTTGNYILEKNQSIFPHAYL